ncbi:hypothetical protein HN51_002482 [Arachis hypogaea]
MSLPFPSLPFRSAARDCIPQERNSFVNFQAKTGVENAELCLVLLDRWILLIKLRLPL